MADHAARVKAMEKYLTDLAAERQRVIDETNAAVLGTQNKAAAAKYKDIGTRQLQQLDTFKKQATDARSFHQNKLYAKTPGSAGASDKTQMQIDEQKPQAELAKNRQEQLKAFNANTAESIGANGKGFLDALKGGPGVPNYTLGPDGRPITSMPHSVTMLVPKDRNDAGDRQDLADEKARLLARKGLDTDIAAAFITPTGKPATAEAIFGGGGIKFDPSTGKILQNKTGFVFTGDPSSYYDMERRYNESKKAEKEASRFNEVTVPADQYQTYVKQAGSLMGGRPGRAGQRHRQGHRCPRHGEGAPAGQSIFWHGPGSFSPAQQREAACHRRSPTGPGQIRRPSHAAPSPSGRGAGRAPTRG